MRRCCFLAWLLVAWMLWQETTFWGEARVASLERVPVGTAETRAECERLADQHATRLTDLPKRSREWRARAGNVVAVYEGMAHKTSLAYRCQPAGAESR